MMKAGSKDLVLKYYHYSLAMNEDRRMAMWTAANVDYKLKTKLTRKELGTDDWRADPRISGLRQITRTELYDPARNVDLGHIVRRNDSAWGKTDTEAEFANSDTFHYTNCTPQHEAFNRTNPPKSEGYEGIHGIWGRLEDQIQSQLELVERKASIFAGPVLDNANDPTENFGLGEIQYPMKFWKVICVVDKVDGPIAYGFLLDQTDVVEQFGLGVEKLNFNSFKKQQIKLNKITELTGVVFDDALYAVDVLKNNTDEGGDEALRYEKVEDIQLRRRVLDN
jgi:endonuclease G